MISFIITCQAQSVTGKLEKAYELFERDPQLRNAITSIYITDGATGKVLFERNSIFGLVPASTQKIITSVSAFQFLGSNFRYKTDISLAGDKASGILKVSASGDPTLGSWRWTNTSENNIVESLIYAVKSKEVKNIEEIVVNGSGWDNRNIPDGWILQDIGNYYGAGVEALNWRENQFDLYLQSGAKVGDPVKITGTNPQVFNYSLESQLTSASKGSGDNAYIYLPLGSGPGVVRGTIPIGESRFVISGAFPSPAKQFSETLKLALFKNKLATDPEIIFMDANSKEDLSSEKYINIYTHISPSLDSIIYWLNRKSINMYAEALLKTVALQKEGLASTEGGIEILKKFWRQQGIDESQLNLVDGSGLSPLNRVTTKAQVSILEYARKQPWFKSFYNSLPEYNGMKMKSGTIGGVKAFTGYHQSKSGDFYMFSFIVNNYYGASTSLVQKMYQVLNVLK